MSFWHRLIIAAAVFVAVSIVARIVDWRLSRRDLPPEMVTRYRVLRRSVSAVILVVGFFSALLVIPEVRAIAGGLLASSAVLGIIVGFASQSTLGNFVAGLLIAITQPVRLGDRVTYAGESGVIEDIGLTYTFIRTADRARIVVPNQKLASDTIRNSTIRSEETLAEVTVQVPADAKLRQVVDSLRGEGEQVLVTDLASGNATVLVRRWVRDEHEVDEAASDMRIAIAEKLARTANGDG
jgi:small-conductance mechanosensitive channel